MKTTTYIVRTRFALEAHYDETQCRTRKDARAYKNTMQKRGHRCEMLKRTTTVTDETIN